VADLRPRRPVKRDKGGNVVEAVNPFADLLADRTASKDDRVEALKFLVHFMGDLHQPLHCAERNGDAGGNKRVVFLPGHRAAMGLHAVWDTFILKRSKGTRSVEDYGGELNARITSKQAKTWAKGTPLDWAKESWQLARDVAYVDLPADGDPPKLTEEYLARAPASAGCCLALTCAAIAISEVRWPTRQRGAARICWTSSGLATIPQSAISLALAAAAAG
jgi:hypothetical protein